MSHAALALVLGSLTLHAAPTATPTCPGGFTAEVASRRAVALGLLASRAWVEVRLLRARSEPEVAELRDRTEELARRAKAWGVEPVLTGPEKALLGRALGAWSRAEVVQQSWAMEQAGTLLWALGVSPQLPGYDQPFTMGQALKPIMAKDGAAQVTRRPRLRAVEELRAALSEASLFAWRAHAEHRQRRPSGKGGTVAPETRTRIREALEAKVTTKTDGTDLLVGGVTVAALSGKKLGLVTGVSQARRDVLRLLCPERPG
jgi:hypothetical protein